MPRSTREIIGDIINPPVRTPTPPEDTLHVQPVVPLATLLGAVLRAPGRLQADPSTPAAEAAREATPPTG